MKTPRFGDAHLAPLFSDPGVHLSPAREAELEHAWRRLQFGACRYRRILATTTTTDPVPRRRGGCGGPP